MLDQVCARKLRATSEGMQFPLLTTNSRELIALVRSAFNAPATCLVDFQARASRARRRTGAGLRQVELLKRLKTQEAIAGRSQMTTAAICTPLL